MQLRQRNKNSFTTTEESKFKPKVEDWKLGSCVKIKVLIKKLPAKFLLNHANSLKYFTNDVPPTKRKYDWILPMSLLQDNKTKKKNSDFITIRKRFECPLCTKFFLNENYVRNIHYKRAHTNHRPFKCQYCNKEFAVKYSLTQHLEIHAQKPHICRICKKSFSNAHSLEAHIPIHDLLGEKCACHICNKLFGNDKELKKHLETANHRKRIKYLSCPVCSKAFYEKSHLKNHLRVHTGKKPYKCNFCTKSFSELGNLKRHLRGHTGEKPHICKICKKEFFEARNLRRHLDSRKETLHCKVKTCNYQFCLMRDLVTHIRFTHSDSIVQNCHTLEEKKFLILYRLWRNRRARSIQICKKNIPKTSGA